MLRQSQDKRLVALSIHAEEGVESALNRFQRAMVNHAQTTIQGFARSVMMFVPRGESSDDHAGTRRFQRQRRLCSNVSRTASAVRVGSPTSGTATTSFPRFFKVIGRWWIFMACIMAKNGSQANHEAS